MKRLLVVAASAAVLVGAGASGAFAGEVKGPPNQVDNTNETGALDHANSACAASGLNDFDSTSGQNESQVQTAADSWKAQATQQMRIRDVWMDYGVVLSDEIGQPLAPWSVSTDFRRLVHELELPRTRFHDLRHAHATQLRASGVHPKAVSERLGYSSVAFTMDTYSAVIPSLGRAAADAADQLFG
jgi:hypothetical protein